MKKLFFLLTLLLCTTFATLLAQKTNINNDIYQKVIFATGLNEIANIAKNEIFPKLRFLLHTLPDSVWDKYETEYDSAKLYLEISKNLQSHFSTSEAQKYYQIAQNLLMNFNDTSIPKFEYFLSKMDSLEMFKAITDSLLDKSGKEYLELERKLFNKLYDSLIIKLFHKIDKTKIESPQKDIQMKKDLWDSLGLVFKNLDSLFLEYFGRSFKWDSLRKEFYLFPPYQSDTFNFELKLPDTLIFRDGQIFSDSTTQFLFLDTSGFKLNLKKLENYSQRLKEYSKFLNEYFKLWKLYIDSLLSYYRKSFELIRKYSSNESINKQIEQEIEKLTKEMEEFTKKIEKEYLKLFEKYKNEFEMENQLFYKKDEFEHQLSNLNLEIEELNTLLKKHKELIEDLVKLKKQIEIEILNDLKKRGYINE